MRLGGIAQKSFGGIVALALTSGAYTFGQTRSAPVDPGVSLRNSFAGRNTPRISALGAAGYPRSKLSKTTAHRR